MNIATLIVGDVIHPYSITQQESWFIQTTALKEKFIANNEAVNWYPDHIKHGRFGNFLEQMVDWNISRKSILGNTAKCLGMCRL